MSEFDEKTFWVDRVNESVKSLADIYNRHVEIDREYKDGLAKISMDGHFIVVVRNDNFIILAVVDTIYSMLSIFRNEQIDDLQKRFSALFD